jgi:ABC-type phosphate/phosphonate transport system permease subunit
MGAAMEITKSSGYAKMKYFANKKIKKHTLIQDNFMTIWYSIFTSFFGTLLAMLIVAILCCIAIIIAD